MIIHGREVQFLLTVGATKKITRICPDKDFKNFSKVFKAFNGEQQIDALAIVAAAMSEGYEQNKKYTEPDYVPHPLTEEEALTLTIDQLSELQDQIMKDIDAGMETSVATKPAKGSKKKEAETKLS